MLKAAIPMACAVGLGACSSAGVSSAIPSGAAAYSVFPSAAEAQARPDYRIGALDSIDVTVFQEPELSAKAAAVDASGMVTLPLVGPIAAAGRSPSELSAEIARRLGEKYLVDPQVSVAVADSASQKVTVQGEVTEPGVYPIRGSTSLLEALALAKGETRVAALGQVVVFRTVSGRRLGGLFDVASIRRGEAEDPQILGNDVIVVGNSSAKSLWRDIVTTAPILNVFRPLGY